MGMFEAATMMNMRNLIDKTTSILSNLEARPFEAAASQEDFQVILPLSSMEALDLLEARLASEPGLSASLVIIAEKLIF